MEVNIKTLDILFRRISPESILNRITSNIPIDDEFYKKAFLNKAEDTLAGYSFEEKCNIYDIVRGQKNFSAPPFDCLYIIGERFLESERCYPICRFQEILNWREAYLLLGQDVFTTAWLAKRSQSGFELSSFAWPAVIPTNNAILNGITMDLAENHMHLYAGASTFALSWCCLMNHPEVILTCDWLEDLLQEQHSRGVSDNMWSMKRRMIYASFLRTLLFKKIYGENAIVSALCNFNAKYSEDEDMCIQVKNDVDGLRYIFGTNFPQPGSLTGACLDYAFTSELKNDQESDSRLFAGERFLMYNCFKQCFTSAFSLNEQWVFYIYLLLKAQLRSELVQVNRQTGFHNFSNYDHRKKLLWERFTEYWNEDYRQSINAPLHEQHISSLEGRLSPRKTAFEDVKLIQGLDRAKLYFDNQDPVSRYKLSRWTPSFDMHNLAQKEPYFFVFHFPKKPDEPLPDEKQQAFPYCRHDKLRKTIRSQAIELAKALSNCSYLRNRIRGIDACSNEIGCRPEVFASVFRFLRTFPIEYYRSNYSMNGTPHLGVTYHVGEDFLDIVDGLRAIDEAIYFLNMRRGDRLGHALALGVDPQTHFIKKRFKIALSQQDLLDNLVWLRYRSRQLNVRLSEGFKDMLEEKAQWLFNVIYKDHVADKSTTLIDYYHSMLLRGDDPLCYMTGEFQELTLTDPFDMFCKNECESIKDKLVQYRRQKNLTDLYFCYHYCLKSKREGAKLVMMDITPEYVSLVKNMQMAMQAYVNDQGIGIECNPSSNVLIGTFGQYYNHPILNFNNTNLNLPQKSVQMHVSVNSDDPGVFDTSLTFEYALLARTLSEMTDENNQRINTDRDIEDYIRRLAQMGREQCFPEVMWNQ